MNAALDAEVSFFRENGFVIVPDLLTPSELEQHGAAVDAAVRSRMSADTRELHEKSRYEQSFQQCLNLWEDFDAVRPLSFHPRIASTAARLLGVPAVRVWHDQALYKEAGGKSTEGHYDHAYWPMEETDAVTAWIPFQDVTPQNGGMGYVPGSHGFGLRAFANIFSGNGFDLETGPEARGVPVVFPDIPAGSVAFHHALTLHMAKPNPTEHARRVHTVIFFADGNRRGAFPPGHPSVDRAAIARGQKIESPFTPLAWPRPADAPLPEPPPLPSPLRRGWPGWPGKKGEKG